MTRYCLNIFTFTFIQLKLISQERIKLIRFLAENGINANTFSDAEIRQKTQKIISERRLIAAGKTTNKMFKKQAKKSGGLSIKKLSGSKKSLR